MFNQHPKRQWNEWGRLWVYEGDQFVVAGNRKLGYSVAEKSEVTIDKPEKIQHKFFGYYGNYTTRKKARALFNVLERESKTGGLVLIGVEGSQMFQSRGAHISHIPKTGATFIAYAEERPIDIIHEIGHHILGHVRRGQSGYNWDRELGAVKFEIEELSKLGKYNLEERATIIKNLSTYNKTKRGTEETSLKRAKEAVEVIETNLDISGPSRLPEKVIEIIGLDKRRE